jgi:23S rRNA (uracil1939-C5)-methyltransferase
MTQTHTIDRLGHHGDGIAPGPVFAPGALPGEVVTGRLDGQRLTDLRIVTPSPHRRKPPCPHARACGGCALQQADDAFVAGWKQDVVRLALQGQGLDAPFRPIVTSPPHSRRRATLSGRRGKAGAALGFHMRGSDQLIPVPDCQLLHPDLRASFPALAAITETCASRKAEVSLSITTTLTGPDVVVTGGKALDVSLWQDLAALAEAHGLARLTYDGETIALRSQPLVQMGTARVPVPPGAFLQATEQGEAALLAAVRDAIGPARRVIDLFAGAGTFTLPLAETAEVHAIEGDAALTAALEAGARGTPGLKRITVETRDLFRRPLMPAELRADAVVIDPPRAGAEAQTEQITQAQVPVIAYVSCNPATFARDARVFLAAGYGLDWVQVVDQFRWSTHVELAARLSLSHIAR